MPHSSTTFSAIAPASTPSSTIGRMWGCIILIFALGITLRWSSSLSHDVAWTLTVSKRILDGQQLYVDLIEVNPPLVFWLSVPIAAAAEIFSVSLAAAFKFTTFALAAISIFLCVGLCQKIRFQNWPIFCGLIAFALALQVGKEFGQREHWLVILTLPYILLVVARRERIDVGPLLSVTIGVLAAIGLCLKPYFLLLPIALELYLLRQLGWRNAVSRFEPWAMGIVGLIYAASIILLTPAYFSKIIPYAGEVYQAGYGADYDVVFLNGFFEAFGLIAAVIWFMARPHLKRDALLEVLLLVGISFFLMFVIQAKGWNYHLVPTSIALVLACGVMVSRALHDLTGSLMKFVTTAMLLFPVSLLTIMPMKYPQYDSRYSQQWKEVVSRYPGTKSVLIMSDNVYQGFPFITESGLTWASRYPALWLTPGIVLRRKAIGGTTPLLDEIEEFNRRTVGEDIARYEPELIFVDQRKDKGHFAGVPFDYVEDFSKHRVFETEWKNYEQVELAHEFAIYKRKSP